MDQFDSNPPKLSIELSTSTKPPITFGTPLEKLDPRTESQPIGIAAIIGSAVAVVLFIILVMAAALCFYFFYW